ncbi:hypothetical protein Tco_0132328 [Tanacetum coccineum]
MVNDDIKKSKAYQTYLAISTGVVILKTYLAISTGVVIPKKARKGIKTPATPKKNVTEKPTCDESDDEEEGRLTRRRPSSVVIRDNPNVSTKKTLDQYKKLKGMEILLDAGQLPADTQKEIKANNKSYRLQQQTKGSIVGAGITLEVPYEPKEKSKGLSKGAGITPKVPDEPKGNEADEETIDDDEELHEDEYAHNDDDEKHDDADDEMNDDELKDDQEMADAEKKEKPEVPPSRSSRSLSSNYGNQFLNLSSDTSLAVLVIPLHSTPTPTFTTPTPLSTQLPTPPISSEAPTITTIVPDPLPAVIQRLSDLKKKFESWTKVDHSEAIEASVQANLINEVKNILPKFLPKTLSDFINPRLESTVPESLSEYELKNILFYKKDKSRSYMTPDKHQQLYDALLNSICLDNAMASGAVNPDQVQRKRDRGDDQDPTTGSDQGKKKRRKGKDAEPSKKSST